MLYLEMINSKKLLFVIFKLSGKQNKGFSIYFNNIRDRYEIKHNSDKRYHSSPGQVHNWLHSKTPETIRDTNFSREMARFIFNDIYGTYTNNQTVLELLLVTLEEMGYDISRWQQQFQNCNDVSDYDNLWDNFIDRLIGWAFTTPKTKKTDYETKDVQQFKVKVEKRAAIDMPQYLTDIKYISKSALCFRDDILANLHTNLLPDNRQMSKTNIVLHGLGGIGKSSIAQRFLAEAIDSKLYDSYGWIDYNISIKESILNHNVFHLYETEYDLEKRWKLILSFFQTTSSRILLFIDNVDRNVENGQNPTTDSDLQFLVDCPAVNLVLTSRLRFPVTPRAIVPLEVPPLDEEQCYKLFLHYWTQIPNYNDELHIRKIIREFVHYHTLAIKLIALGSRGYNMNVMIQTIEKCGFHFKYLEDGSENSAAKALLLLFNTKSRSDKQNWLLWHFSLLPQTSLSLQECKELFGFERAELLNLSDEGWLTNENGFSMHPLIKQAMSMTYEKEGHYSLQGSLTPRIIRLVTTEQLITAGDTQQVVLRKLSLADSFSENYIFEPDIKTIFFYNLALMEFKRARKRLSAIRHLNVAKDACTLFLKNGDNYKAELASILYELGYIESTTHKYRSICKNELRAALEFWLSEPDKFQFKIAKAKSHLGYVLSDNSCDYEEARLLLLDAEKILDDYRNKNNYFDETEPTWLAYERSSVLDNLGMLLWKIGGADNLRKAKDSLMEAFAIRENLKSDTDIAWTAFNIGKLLSENEAELAQAEYFLSYSLKIRRKQDTEFPNMYTTNVVFTLVTLAKVLLKMNKKEKAKEYLTEAITLKNSIDEEHTGFFSDEIKQDIMQLQNSVLG